MCAITFTELPALQRFLEHNPPLRETALLSGPNGFTLFIRIDGFRPRTTTVPYCKWLGQNELVPVCLRRKFTQTYTWNNKHKPLELSFSEIIWPDGMERMFAFEQVEFTYHSPFYADRKGNPVLNLPYWSALFARINTVKYCPGSQTFYQRDVEAQEWVELSITHIKAAMLEFMLQNGGRPGYEVLLRPCSDRQLDDLIKSLRLVAIGEDEDAGKALNAFVADCLEAHTGTDVTVAELYSAFVGFCQRGQQPHLTQAQFCDRSPALIQSRFAIGRSNSIDRNGKARRGYYNLRLKLSVHSSAPEVAGTVGTAGTG
jgi:hypothetical protein